MTMRKFSAALFRCIPFTMLFSPLLAQQRPKLVVGIVVDQMRWDYLQRYQARWQPGGGFSRLLNDGFRLENTQINYLPSQTAPGHASIYTGSVPAYHGITGNTWWSHLGQGYQYCTSDSLVKQVGGKAGGTGHSPVQLLGTTICDELRLATNFRGKSIGIAMKDRGAVLAAGHSANAAYWYDGEAGEWVSSTYYMNSLPKWTEGFRTVQKVDSLYKLGWKTLYPIETYHQSTTADKNYVIKTFGGAQGKLPYSFDGLVGKRYDAIVSTPHGNTLTAQFAMAAIEGEQLGKDSITDFLAVSFSSIDVIGHAYGPNAIEMEDAMLRLDNDLGKLMGFLDKEVGQNEYLIFLTADHGVVQIPGFLTENRLPRGLVTEKNLMNDLNVALRQEFGEANLVKAIINNQIVLDIPQIKRVKKLGESEVTDFALEWLYLQPFVSRAVRLENIGRVTLPAEMENQIANSYLPARCGHIQILYRPGYIEGYEKGGTTHGTAYTYDTHIPLIFYGGKITAGKSYNKAYITDIAPTVAALLGIQEPANCIGSVITELFGKQTK